MGFNIRPLHIGKFLPPPYAGVEAHIDTLLRSLLPEVESTLVTGELNGCKGAGTPFRSVTFPSFGKIGHLPFSPSLIPFVLRELDSGRSNLLHLHAPNPFGDISSIFYSGKQPTVMTWHSDIVRQRNFLKFYRPIQKKVLGKIDRIIVFTPKHYESSEQLHQINVENKISVIPIGIDFDLLDNVETDFALSSRIREFAAGRKILLTIGRHTYYKGYEYLLTAMSKIRSDVVLVMVGAGPLFVKLLQQSKNLGLSGKVIFLGEVTREALVTSIRCCDYFCLPSVEKSEAFGIATAEAKASGKPSIVCELNNGVNYLTQDGVTGISVEPKNPLALADAIDILALDDGLRSKMGLAAKEWVRNNFSVSVMRDMTLKLYAELV